MQLCHTTSGMIGPRLRALVLGASAVAMLAGCEPIRQTHGYVPAATYVDRINVGTDGRAEVVSKIGRPSTSAAFEDDEWFYISRSTETKAFFAPKAIEQKVMVLAFDDSGTVKSIDNYALEDGRVIDLVTKTTPTRGKRLTFLQQLIGNIGRFTPEQITGDDSVF